MRLLRSRQEGQAIIIGAFILPVLMGAVGMALDGFTAYYWAARAQGAASAGALAGVIYMPDRFPPASPPSRLDAVDRAMDAVQANGFSVGSPVPDQPGNPLTDFHSSSGQVLVQRVQGKPHELRVVVLHRITTTFMNVLGVGQVTVRRSAVAVFLPSVELGQSGTQVGTTAGDLGRGTSPPDPAHPDDGLVLAMEGWNVPGGRSQGDPYTPDPGQDTDVHTLSARLGSDVLDPMLPDRGGYNFVTTLTAPGRIQVYNAGASFSYNPCDNAAPVARRCGADPSPSGTTFYADFVNQPSPSPAPADAMLYTLFREPQRFTQETETELVKMRVDAFQVSLPGPPGTAIPHYTAGAQQWDQTYGPLNADPISEPNQMRIYHAWSDIASYQTADPALDHGLVSYLAGPGHGPAPLASPLLPPGTYRLRIDMIDRTAPRPPALTDYRVAYTTTQMNKRYAVRVAGDQEQVCAPPACGISAKNEMCFVTARANSAISVPIFRLPPEYADTTISIYFYDVGDASAPPGLKPSVSVDILNYLSGSLPVGSPGSGIGIYGHGTSRSGPPVATFPPPNPTGPDQQDLARFRATDPTFGQAYQGKWVEVRIPVDKTYQPVSSANQVWSMRYNSQNVASPVDVLTVFVTGTGNAVRTERDE